MSTPTYDPVAMYKVAVLLLHTRRLDAEAMREVMGGLDERGLESTLISAISLLTVLTETATEQQLCDLIHDLVIPGGI